MSFAGEVNRFVIKTKAANGAVFVDMVAALKASIVEGSALTGAPGQPVYSGNLANSWQEVVAPDLKSAVIGVGAERGAHTYAEAIEDGVGRYGPLTLRSNVGGFHSVKLTVANADALLADVARRHTV